MPLLPGKSKATVSGNIRELMATGKYPQRQAIAIALSNARRHPRKLASGGIGDFDALSPIGGIAGADMDPETLRGLGSAAATYDESGRPLSPDMMGEAKAVLPSKEWTRSMAFGKPMSDTPEWVHGLEQASNYGTLAGGPMIGAIKAFHGSPHDFNAFDMSKIGTGEGAQVYGHVLYFAENQGVAKQYRNDLAHKGNKVFTPQGGEMPASLFYGDDATKKAFRALKDAGSYDVARQRLATELDNVKSWGKTGEDTAAALSKLDELKAAGYDAKAGGVTYEVSIDADPEHFLDWDKPLSEQPKAVQEALAKTPGIAPEYLKSKVLTGGNLVPKNPDAMEALRAAGIKGIRYADQGSRIFDADAQGMIKNYGSREKALEIAQKRLAAASTASDRKGWTKTVQALEKPQTSNYVVFDDKIINIDKIYERGGMLAQGGLAAYKSGGKASGDRSFVKLAQRLLQQKGLYTGKIDGIAGTDTRAAINAFQKAAGMPVTGTMTADTLDALKAPPLPRPRPAAGIASMGEMVPTTGGINLPPDAPFVSADKEGDLSAMMAARIDRNWDEQAKKDDLAQYYDARKMDLRNQGPPLPPSRGFASDPTMTAMPGLGAAIAASPRAVHPVFGNADPTRTEQDTGMMSPEDALLIRKKAATLHGMDPTADNFAKGGRAKPAMVKPPKPVHVGMIKSSTPGRTDRLPMAVPKDSYVVPADVIGGLGQGNSDAGAKIVNDMLHPHRMKLRLVGARHKPGLAFGKAPHGMAAGGPADAGEPVDIIAAGGEMVIPPDDVLAVGGGDMKEGHRLFDQFVLGARKQIAQRMMRLAPPKR